MVAEDGGTQQTGSIKAIDAVSAHRITSGQVVIDLQTAVKELLENSLDAGATSIEVRFKDYGLDAVEVIDNGSGIAPEDYDSVALKHHTSKLASFEDLNTVQSFGFRGEALSALCALAGSVTVVTATADTAPMGTILEFDRQGRVTSRNGRVARQRGTTVTVSGIFKPLPVRRKEFERNAKREFGKALNLLNAYALVPCAETNGGVRLTCTNQPNGGRKTVQLRTDGAPSLKTAISALWGPKVLENIVDLDLSFEVETERSVLHRRNAAGLESGNLEVSVRGVISKFALDCGRSGSDRQFFFINGRPCSPSKVQKAFNDVYRTFNVTQLPFIVANFVLPNGSHDVNVSPDKRTILIHSEANLVQALKVALEQKYAPERSTYQVNATQPSARKDTRPHAAPKGVPSLSSGDTTPAASQPTGKVPLFLEDDEERSENVEGNGNGDEFDLGEPGLLVETKASVEEAQLLAQSENPRQGHLFPLEDDIQMADETVDDDLLDEDDLSPSSQGVSVEVDHARSPSPTVTQLIQKATSAQQPVLPAPIHESSRARYPALPPHSQPTSSPIPSIPSALVYSSTSNNSLRVKRDSAAQLVLSTSGASWNLRRMDGSDAGEDERPRKRLKSDDAATSTLNRQSTSRLDMRARLAGYALPGSQLPAAADESDDVPDELVDETVEEASESGRGPSASPPASTREATPLHNDTHDQDAATSSNDIPPALSLAPGHSSDNTVDLALDDEMDVEATVNLDEPASQGKPPEYIRTAPLETATMRLDVNALSATWRNAALRRRQPRPVTGGDADVEASAAALAHDAGVSGAMINNAEAEEALSRVIDKTDFSSMEIVGQFNLGFIIVRRRRLADPAGAATSGHGAEELTRAMDDLFIVDQHAADEKYNFEKLQQTTKIDSQRLIRPRPLELTAADELIAIESLDVLRQNGFEIEIEETDSDRDGRRSRLKLVAQPVSKATVFDTKDLEELLHLLQDRPGHMVRCSKARAMFAMRACRKSIMVGTSLTAQQMTAVVRHMGSMDQPWNCPHGRPTMRHLSDIAQIGRDHLSDKRLDWRPAFQ